METPADCVIWHSARYCKEPPDVIVSVHQGANLDRYYLFRTVSASDGRYLVGHSIIGGFDQCL